MSKDKGSGVSGPASPDRREILSKIGAGVVTAALGAPVVLSVRSCVPNALYEKPLRFKAGTLERFGEGPTFLAEQRVFVFRQSQTFYCVSGVCTHLGCTVQLARQSGPQGQGYEFHCPCHGSRYTGDGTPYTGPAPTPLSYYKLEVAPDDGQLIVDLSQPADRGWRLTV